MTPFLSNKHWLIVLALSLSACQPSGAQAPRSEPAAEEIAQAYHPSYKVMAGTRSECLGRLAFDIPAKPAFEWGLPKRVRTNKEILGFSRILNGGQDTIHLANVAVVVAAEASRKTILEMQESVETDKNIALQDFDEKVRVENLAVKDLTEQLQALDVRTDQAKVSDFKKGIQDALKKIDALQIDKLEFDKDWHPTDWGIPNSTGYIAGPTLYAFLLRNGFAFQFMSTGGEGEAPFEQRLAAFKDLLSRFEYRPLYQVPAKTGLCIPHGFINDNGQGHFQAEVSYRFTDSPGVIYTLATAVEGERDFHPNEPLLEATGRSTVAGLVGNGYGRKLTAIGPKNSNIGARAAVLGGIYTTEGVPGYSIYAGARGWDHSQVLPFISLNMRSFDRETAPEDLKVNPPSFMQSMKQFELTLGSVRTRQVP